MTVRTRREESSDRSHFPDHRAIVASADLRTAGLATVIACT